MKILIAGSSGIIGSFLYNSLTQNYEIFNIADRPPKINQNNFNIVDLKNSVETEKFISNIDKIDILVFLTGLAHYKGRSKETPLFHSINYLTLKNITDAFKSNNIHLNKIIFSSTISVYGENYHRKEYSEEATPLPKSPYARTKFLAEQYLFKKFPKNSWILRFAPVYSDEFKLNIDRRTMLGSKYFRIGSANNKLSLLNIRNISKTIEGIIDDRIPPGVYNLADRKDYTYNDLLNKVKAKNICRIPIIFTYLAYFVGLISKNVFLKENSIKLISDNTFPSNKIRQYIDLPYTLNGDSSG